MGEWGNARGAQQQLGLLLENLYTNASTFLFFISLGYYFTAIENNFGYLWLAVTAAGIKLITRYTILHMNILRNPETKKSDSEEGDGQLFRPGFLNETKFFFVRVANSARLYFVAFLLVFLLWPRELASVFVWYFSFIIVLSFAKLFLVLARKQS